MTPEQSAWLRGQIAAGVKRHEELIAAKQSLADWPRSAWEDPPALLIYCDSAMYAYYLGPNGKTYYYDMDKFWPELHEIGLAETIREIYKRASETFPELAGITP